MTRGRLPSKAARDLARRLARYGLDVVPSHSRNPHPVVMYGRKRVMRIPATPSDSRSMRNAEAQALRWLREHGTESPGD